MTNAMCRSFFRALQYLVVAVPFLAMLGCDSSNVSEQANQRLFLVLVDETESFSMGTTDTLYWSEVLPLVSQIAGRLQPGDEFAVIGIDEKGFEDSDVRIPFRVLDEGFLRAKLQKDSLLTSIQHLQRRKNKHRTTDILGALYHSAHFANVEQSRKTILFCFSDMKQEPTWPTEKESSDLHFPNGTEGYFFYVNASGRTSWNTITGVWQPILTRARVEISSGGILHFYQRGDSRLKLSQVLDSLSV